MQRDPITLTNSAQQDACISTQEASALPSTTTSMIALCLRAKTGVAVSITVIEAVSVTLAANLGY